MFQLRARCALGIGNAPDAAFIRKFKNRHPGRRAFVIGNGPSLRMADLQKLCDRQEICFASNKIFLAFRETEWRPTYHLVESDVILKESLAEIAACQHQRFMSLDALEFADRLPDVGYYRRDFQCNPLRPRFQKRPLGHIYAGYSVLYSCLQFAYYMGIEEVHFLGVDFNYKKPSRAGVSSGRSTYYVSDGEQNHFAADYKQPGQKWYDPNLEYQRVAFAKARRVYERSGRRLLNATRGGMLDVLERCDFDRLMTESPKS